METDWARIRNEEEKKSESEKGEEHEMCLSER